MNRLKIRIREYRKRNQPETVEHILSQHKRLNKINHFDRSIRRGHSSNKNNDTTTSNAKSDSNKPNTNSHNNNNNENIVSQLSNNDSPNYYYHYSKTTEFSKSKPFEMQSQQQLLPLPPSYYYSSKQMSQPAVSTSDYFDTTKDTNKSTVITNLKSSFQNLPQSLNVHHSIPQRTTTFSRSNLSLNLTQNHNRIEQRKKEDLDDEEEESDNEEEHVTLKASDEEPDQLIVEELKESPKSTYSRYFSNTRLNRSSFKEKSCSPIDIIEIDQSPKTSRLNYLLYSRQNLTDNKTEPKIDKNIPSSANDNKKESVCRKEAESSLSETKSLSSESYEHLTVNDITSNRSTSISSLNETLKSKKNSQLVVKLRKKNLNQNKRVKKSSKTFSVIGSGSSYDNTIRSSNPKVSSPIKKPRSTSKLRLISLNKNKISSDIDIEDDLIFNDDTDSLSSAGVSCTPTSATPKPLVNESQHTLVNSSCKLKSNSDSENTQQPQAKTPNASMKTSFSADTQIKLAKLSSNNTNSCSISDIDPDDNILNNLLVKQKSKENT